MYTYVYIYIYISSATTTTTTDAVVPLLVLGLQSSCKGNKHSLGFCNSAVQTKDRDIIMTILSVPLSFPSAPSSPLPFPPLDRDTCIAGVGVSI